MAEPSFWVSCAKVFFVHHAVLIDDERHDAGVAILGGIGDEGEAAGS